MEVYVATSTKAQPDEIQRIVKLFELGLSTLHLRRPKISTKEMSELISSIPKKYHSKIVIHGHYELVQKFGLKGYCVKRRHRSDKRKNRLKRFWLRLKNPSKVTCTSYRTIQSFKDSKNEQYDYIILNDVISSGTDQQFRTNSLRLIKTLVAKSEVPVMAQGGINRATKPHVLNANFHGVILSSAIFNSPESQYLDEYTAFAEV